MSNVNILRRSSPGSTYNKIQLSEALLHLLERFNSLSVLFEKKSKPQKICLPISFRMCAAVIFFLSPFLLDVLAFASKGLEVNLTEVVFPGCLWLVSLPINI